ncbi:hypothetical protein NIES4071_78490 [Calothrix sp. NIES-4071]|nr:hypothetical protein NIES4071_78490 [Calothrix sp. NIES-4071]BAZ62121.1 hypothetical protein NIES4105_78420 [Calothrix sp. NIES-4105]
MAELPKTLEDAIIQAQQATQAAIADGQTRLQVELLFSELKFMPVAEQFIPGFESYGDKLKVLFADAGASALARRDWGSVPFQIEDVGTGRAASLESKIKPEDELFLFISPTTQEVPQLEQLCQIIGDARPFVMLNPRLEDSSIVGIGYAARQVRERFINTIESCYYLRPIFEEAAVFRCYPGMWEIWVQNAGNYQKVAELPQRPTGEEIDMILAKGQPTTTPNGETVPAKKPNMLRSLQRFLKALSS